MAKKGFKGGLDSLLGSETDKTPKKKVGRPKTSTREIDKSSQEGCKERETRATFIVNEDTLEQIKAIAYWDRLTIKEVINEAFSQTIKKYEKKKGKLKPVPQK